MGALLEIGLGNALMATLLACCAAAAGRFCKRPALIHSLWLLVLVKLLTPPLARFPVVGFDTIRLEHAPPADAPERLQVIQGVGDAPVSLGYLMNSDRNDSAEDSGSESLLPLDRGRPPIVVETPAWEGRTERSAEDGESASLEKAVVSSTLVFDAETEVIQRTFSTGETLEKPGSSWIPPEYQARSTRILGSLWICGSMLWLCLAIRDIGRFRRVLSAAIPASAGLQAQADDIAWRLGLARAPSVWLLPGSVSPLVWAMGGAPRLLIPSRLWEQLDDEQRKTLLTHELAHIVRRDHWVRVLELAATVSFWWHPVVWWARRELREAEEQCCDAWVVWAWPRAAKAYATALVDTLDFLSESRSRIPSAASGAGHGRVEHFTRRISMILTGLTPKSLTAAGRLVVFALATLLLPFAPISGGAPDDEKKPVTAAARLVEVPVDLDLAVDLVVDDDDDDDKDKGKDKDKAAKEKRPVVQRRVEVRRIETGKGDDKGKEKATKAPVKTEDAAALEKARVELKEAQEALEKAARRVAELQMKINGVGGQGRFEFKTEGDVIVMRKDGDKDVVIREFKLDGPEGVGKRARLFAAPLAGEGMKFNMPVPPGGPFGDQERRLKDLEKKLDKIIGELDSLKKKDAKSGR